MAYVNVPPENALRQADEFIAQGRYIEAEAAIHEAIQSKRNRATPAMMEQLIKKLIDICTFSLSTRGLKEDLSHYRNISQFTQTQQLEDVLKYLREKADEKIKAIREQGIKEISVDNLEADESPEDLMLNAVLLGSNEGSEKESLLRNMKFAWECYKMILDIVRFNAKLLPFYGETAAKTFELCIEFNRVQEFKLLCDTLRSHLTQSIKNEKTQKQANIPNPVLLSDADCMRHVTVLRFKQLEYSTQFKLWHEAFKTIEDIHYLMSKTRTDKERARHLSLYYSNFSKIFWEAGYYLFHAHAYSKYYSLFINNKLKITKEEVIEQASLVILATLSIPFTNPATGPNKSGFQTAGGVSLLSEQDIITENFRKMSNYVSSGGAPTRENLIQELKVKNILLSADEKIKSLYNILTEDNQPAVITKKTQEILAFLESNEHYKKYAEAIKERIAIRLLQQLQKVYQTLKIQKFTKYTSFIDFNRCEKLIMEGNKSRFLAIKIDFQNGVIIFDAFHSENQRLSTHLMNFATRLKKVFDKIKTKNAQSDFEDKKRRIFDKVREKLDEEKIFISQRKGEIIKKSEEYKAEQEEKKQKDDKQREEEESKRKERIREGAWRAEYQRKIEKYKQEINSLMLDKAKGIANELGVPVEELAEDLQVNDLLVKKAEKKAKAEKKHKEDLTSEFQRIDFTERALREKEIPILKEKWEKESEEMRGKLEAALRNKHMAEKELKEVFVKISDSKDAFKRTIVNERKEVLRQQQEEYRAKRQTEVLQKIIADAKKRREDEKRAQEEKQRQIEQQKKNEEFQKAMREEREAKQAQKAATPTSGWRSEQSKQGDTRPGEARQGDDLRRRPTDQKKEDDAFGSLRRGPPKKEEEKDKKIEESGISFGGRWGGFKNTKKEEEKKAPATATPSTTQPTEMKRPTFENTRQAPKEDTKPQGGRFGGFVAQKDEKSERKGGFGDKGGRPSESKKDDSKNEGFNIVRSDKKPKHG